MAPVFRSLSRDTEAYIIKNWADTTYAAARWVRDSEAVSSIVKKLCDVSKDGCENDTANLQDLGEELFIFHKMQLFLFCLDNNECTKSYDCRLKFNISDIEEVKTEENLIISPKGQFYSGAIYKRFKRNSFAILFEIGEVYICAESESDTCWIGGYMNNLLFSLIPEEKIKTSIENYTDRKVMIEVTKELEELELWKHLCVDRRSVLKRRRVQPERKVKQKQ